MLSDEMTFRALLAASAAERQGFHATAEAFLALARGSILDMLKAQPWIDQPPWTTDRSIARIAECRIGQQGKMKPTHSHY